MGRKNPSAKYKRRNYPASWDEFLEHAEMQSELGGDPFDIEDGDILANADKDVRIVCNVYNGGSGQRVLWVDPYTGIVHDDPMMSPCASCWADWAGEQLWNLSNKDGHGWYFRSPFNNHIEYGGKPDT